MAAAGLLGLVLALFPLLLTETSANQDTILQLLMTEGFDRGAGYGYFDEGEFVPMSSRHPATRWPPGLTAIGWAVEKAGGDPLVVLTGLYPVELLLFYLLLVAAARPHVDLLSAAVLAFAASTPVIVLDSFTRLTTESYALVLMAALFALVTRPAGGGAAGLARRAALLALVSIGLTMMRFAGAFVVPGACVLFALFWIGGWSRRAAFVVATGAVAALPLAAVLWYLGPAPPVPAAIAAAGRVHEDWWQMPAWLWFLREFPGHVRILSETLAPRVARLTASGAGMLAAGSAVVAVIAAALAKRRPAGSGTASRFGPRALALAAAGFAAAYIVMLAAVAAHYRTPWATIYRVAGFSVPLAVIAFGAALLWLAPRRLQGAVLLLLLLLGGARLGNRARMQAAMSGTPPFDEDYRIAVRRTAGTVLQEFPAARQLWLDDEGRVAARHLQRQLWYARRQGAKIPWKVVSTAKAGIRNEDKSSPLRLTPESVLILHEADFPNWEARLTALGPARQVRRGGLVYVSGIAAQ